MMRRHETFSYATSEELLERSRELGVTLPFQDSIAPLFAGVAVSGTCVPNRIAVQPMEGLDATHEGAPGDLTFRRYCRYAGGGSGLIWFEACSVTPAGRSNPRQLMLVPKTIRDFARLVDRTRATARARLGKAHNPYLVLQLTHSGRFSWHEAGAKAKAACHNPYLEKSPDDVNLFSDDELSEIRSDFIAAARLARDAGFDAVDVKACHGYLLHELLSAFTRADSAYGGTFENRSRMLLETVAEIRAAVPGLAIAVRMNATDGIPNPFGFGTGSEASFAPDLSEPLRLQQRLLKAGCSLLNITAGIPRYAPHMGRPYNRPTRGRHRTEIHPLQSVVTLIELAATFQQSCPGLPVVGTGYSWLRQYWPNVGAAVLAQGDCTFIGLGRNSFAYPDAPRDLMVKGKLTPSKCCNACSCCTELMQNHQITGCVLRDSAQYKKPYISVTK